MWSIPCPLIESHYKKEPKIDLLAMTEADREALTKQIKACLELKVAEEKFIRSEFPADEALLDTDVCKPETYSLTWYRGH